MKTLKIALFVGVVMLSGTLLAAYNDVDSNPADQDQYKKCKVYAMNRWNGGGELSPIPGQSKAEAFCTCLWNETSDDFRGGLAKFSESAAGAKINVICEKYSNWGD